MVLHGGEPLLVGPDRLRQIARTLREALSEVRPVSAITPIGYRWTMCSCWVFADEGMRVGISVDGARAKQRAW